MFFSRISPAANWYLVLCTAFCLLDARPAKLISDIAAPLSQELRAEHPLKERQNEFWTRWNSDPGSASSPEERTLLTASIFKEEDGHTLASKVRKDKFVSLEIGCGRGKNRLGILSDGTKLCCRCRELQWRDIRGEFYSYHLNNYLGIFNAPPATLIKVNYSSPQWTNVQASLREAGWEDHTTIAVTLYVEDLTVETFPPILVKDGASVVTREYLNTASSADKHRILQWSDMIVFDFLIGHSDRIFNTLYNLQWNSRMLQRPVHNLLKTKQDDRLLLFDNESGFWQGYRMGWAEPYNYELQERYLKRLCIFRGRTVERIQFLLQGSGNFEDKASASERFARYVQVMDKNSFQMVEPLNVQQREEFENRLRLVMKQVKSCA